MSSLVHMKTCTRRMYCKFRPLAVYRTRFWPCCSIFAQFPGNFYRLIYLFCKLKLNWKRVFLVLDNECRNVTKLQWSKETLRKFASIRAKWCEVGIGSYDIRSFHLSNDSEVFLLDDFHKDFRILFSNYSRLWKLNTKKKWKIGNIRSRKSSFSIVRRIITCFIGRRLFISFCTGAICDMAARSVNMQPSQSHWSQFPYVATPPIHQYNPMTQRRRQTTIRSHGLCACDFQVRLCARL